MLSFKQYITKILEWNEEDGNSPDELYIRNNQGGFYLSWWSGNAYAFIYSTKLDDILVSGMQQSHDDILYGVLAGKSSMSKSKQKQHDDMLRNFDNLLDIRDNKRGVDTLRRDSREDDYDDWLNSDKDILDANQRFKLGRFWIHNEILYISWWDELNTEEFNKYNKTLIRKIKEKENLYGKFNIVYCMENDGKLILFDKEIKQAKIVTNERKKILKIQRAIHLADQKAKQEFFKEFKRHRDANNQQIYNHTKSKTEAEWRSIRYQDSLIDTAKNKINEGR